jgi:hypothetical protein
VQQYPRKNYGWSLHSRLFLANKKRSDAAASSRRTTTTTNKQPTKKTSSRSQKNTGTSKQTPTKRRSWEESFQLLTAYKEKKGDCKVPQKYEKDTGLGLWVREQRRLRKKGSLSEERIVKLNSIGFTWDRHDEHWNSMFERLLSYKEKNGDCNVPQKYEEDTGLGLWVMNQRISRRKGRLSEDRIAKLDSIGFTWDPHDDNWNSMFEQLLSYKERNGDCKVPLRYEKDKSLGCWVFDQKKVQKEGQSFRGQNCQIRQHWIHLGSP